MRQCILGLIESLVGGILAGLRRIEVGLRTIECILCELLGGLGILQTLRRLLRNGLGLGQRSVHCRLDNRGVE